LPSLQSRRAGLGDVAAGNEHIFAAIVGRNEAKALRVVEELTVPLIMMSR